MTSNTNLSQSEKQTKLVHTDLNNLLVMNSFLHTIVQMIDKLYTRTDKIHFKFEKTTITVIKTITNYTFVYFSDKEVEDIVVNKVLEDFEIYVMGNCGYFEDMPINLEMFKPEKYF